MIDIQSDSSESDFEEVPEVAAADPQRRPPCAPPLL